MHWLLLGPLWLAFFAVIYHKHFRKQARRRALQTPNVHPRSPLLSQLLRARRRPASRHRLPPRLQQRLLVRPLSLVPSQQHLPQQLPCR